MSNCERVLPEDWDHFYVLLEEMLKRVPTLEDAVLERLSNGPEAFSPDGRWIMGESPEVKISSHNIVIVIVLSLKIYFF